MTYVFPEDDEDDVSEMLVAWSAMRSRLREMRMRSSALLIVEGSEII